ncbi:hydrogenase 2 operon protein HybA [Photobacterium sagamiensis]|uniref:hydrogenase 2 operon protein HybA n=1 Tax=Photobacterium sagamiensis TaxID=2910241 RepID=UPI003D14BEAB
MIDRRNFLKIAAGTPLLAAAGSSEARPNLEPQPDAVGMLYDSTLCVGCQACVFKCREINGIEVNPKAPDAEIHSRNDKLSPYALNVIQVWESGSADNKDQTEDGYAYMKRQCMHCVDPNCVSVCPVSSMKKDPKTGIVTNDPDTCLGCRYCMVACPFNIPKYEYDNPLGQIQKCQLCNQKGVERLDNGLYPGCVEVCPTGAVIFGRRDELLEEAKRRLQAPVNEDYAYPRLEISSQEKHVKPLPAYEQHIYGEFEGGGTQVLVLSGVPQTTLGLPELEETSTGSRSETVQHTLYKGMVLPLAALTGLMYATRRNMKSHDNDQGKESDHGES